MSSAVMKHELDESKLAQRIDNLESRFAEISQRVPEDKVSIVLLSGDFDKAMAAFFMANGAAAMGMEVSMFFTFWGCSVIKKGRKLKGKSFMHKMFNLMLPANSKALAPSKLAFGGIGRKLFNIALKGNMSPLEEQIEIAKEMGIKFQVCAPSLQIMGFDDDEWIVPIDVCGVGAMYGDALNARTSYFVS